MIYKLFKQIIDSKWFDTDEWLLTNWYLSIWLLIEFRWIVWLKQWYIIINVDAEDLRFLLD